MAELTPDQADARGAELLGVEVHEAEVLRVTETTSGTLFTARSLVPFADEFVVFDGEGSLVKRYRVKE